VPNLYASRDCRSRTEERWSHRKIQSSPSKVAHYPAPTPLDGRWRPQKSHSPRHALILTLGPDGTSREPAVHWLTEYECLLRGWETLFAAYCLHLPITTSAGVTDFARDACDGKWNRQSRLGHCGTAERLILWRLKSLLIAVKLRKFLVRLFETVLHLLDVRSCRKIFWFGSA
jgi:hypothetical protein